MKTITLTAHNRPEYTKTVLESIRANDPQDYILFIAAEPGCHETLDVCRSIDFMPVELIVNESHRGIKFNSKYIYDVVFDGGSKWNIAIEDDTPISPDAIDLVEWFHSLPNQETYLLLNLFNLSKKVERPLELFESDKFCPWGYSIRKQAYERFIKPNWMCHKDGWDFSINKVIEDCKLKCLTPYLSRSRNIGRLKGYHCTPEYHDQVFEGHVFSNGEFGRNFAIGA